MPTMDQINDAAYNFGYAIGYYGWPFFLVGIVAAIVAGCWFLLSRAK